MKSTIVLCVLLLVAPGPAFSAGGSEKQALAPDRLAEADRLYNQGLKHRDKAWEYEKQAAGAAKASDRDTYQKSAEREYDRAIEAFKNATVQNSRHFEAFGSLGYALRKTGQYQEALKSYDRALKMSPDYARAIEYRAEAYLGVNRVDEALVDYRRLVELDVELARTFLAAAAEWLKTIEAPDEGIQKFADVVEAEEKKLGPAKPSSW